jgi:hypothetical protein
MTRRVAAILLAVLLPTLALAGERQAGWTDESIASETEECTKALVDGAWENTKREQGADPALPMSDEVRKMLEPQIAAMKSLCQCAVAAGAARYTKAEADKTPADLDKFVTETIANGTCKLESK